MWGGFDWEARSKPTILGSCEFKRNPALQLVPAMSMASVHAENDWLFWALQAFAVISMKILMVV